MFKKVSVAVALVCALLAVPALANAATGEITGEVTEFEGGAAVPEAEVCAKEIGGGFILTCVLTRSDGTYTIKELADGQYTVEFSKGNSGLNLRKQFYFDEEGTNPPDEVTVSQGTPATEIDGLLEPGGGLEGRVTAEVGGGPVGGVEVCAITGNEYEECVETDGNGEYAFIGLSEVEYEVEFFGGFFGYETQFYENAGALSDATPVPVQIGSSVPGIDAVLVRGAEISGHVYAAADGRPIGNISVCAIAVSGLEPTACAGTEADGSYLLGVLPAGSYKVGFSTELREFFPEAELEEDGWSTLFWNQQPNLAAAETITLGHGDEATNIDARLSPTPTTVTPGPIVQPPVTALPAPVPVSPKPKPKVVCVKGLHRIKRHGKVVCVKPHHKKRNHKKRHHRHRRHHGRHLHASQAGARS
jgi:hypothetical protein